MRQVHDVNRIAVDVESNGMFAYQPDVCTIQFAWELPDGSTRAAIVDTLAIPLPALSSLLGDPFRLKVIHDLAFDARILNTRGIVLRSVRDTSVAATYLRKPGSGLASLLAAEFGIQVSKEKQNSDWSQRPLSTESLAYLADDVYHLLRLDTRLDQQVQQAGIADEVATETAYRLMNALEESAPPSAPHLRIRGAERLGGVQTRILKSSEGKFDPHDVRSALRMPGIQSPITTVICMENTYDLNRGIPLPIQYLSEIGQIARECNANIYLDGARLMNAAAYFGIEPGVLCQEAAIVMLCLTKGLAAPMGSLLAGTRELIDRARWIRQRFGGGMRQAGHMAAAALVALNTMRKRLIEDHSLAQRLRDGLMSIDARIVDAAQLLTNIVRLDLDPVGKKASILADYLLERGIKIKPVSETACRLITHFGITEKDIDKTLSLIKSFIDKRNQSGRLVRKAQRSING